MRLGNREASSLKQPVSAKRLGKTHTLGISCPALRPCRGGTLEAFLKSGRSANLSLGLLSCAALILLRSRRQGLSKRRFGKAPGSSKCLLILFLSHQKLRNRLAVEPPEVVPPLELLEAVGDRHSLERGAAPCKSSGLV